MRDTFRKSIGGGSFTTRASFSGRERGKWNRSPFWLISLYNKFQKWTSLTKWSSTSSTRVEKTIRLLPRSWRPSSHRSSTIHVHNRIHAGTQRFYLEDRLSESELRELKEEAIKKIAGRDSAQMKTIELQITYDTEFLEAELRKQQRTR